MADHTHIQPAGSGSGEVHPLPVEAIPEHTTSTHSSAKIASWPHPAAREAENVTYILAAS